MTVCSVEGCERVAVSVSRGWCSMHYHRWQRHGDPTVTKVSPKGEAMRWLTAHASHVDAECLQWPFRLSDGYGVLHHDGRPRYASRVMCEMVHGAPPSDLPSALHSCGRGAQGCVNPRHLYWGTQSANMRDRIAHAADSGRALSPRARLTPDEARQIIALLAGDEPRREIARRFGVSVSAIDDIARGRTWAWLAEDRRAA